MEHCSRQCIRRTLFAVMVGVSPVLICLLFIAIARLILHRLELIYSRQKEKPDYRRTSSMSYTSRPTLLYTPVSIVELQRIIQGEYQNQEQHETNRNHDNDSPSASKFMKSFLTRHELSPSTSTSTLANLVIRRSALNTTPLTAICSPTSHPITATFDIVNEEKVRRPSIVTIKHESVETTTLSSITNTNNKYANENDSSDSGQIEVDSILTSPQTMTKKTTTTTVVVEEYLDFHSVCSLPYSFSISNNSVIEK